jgi:GNAT superfamily N-acetyltransferase
MAVVSCGLLEPGGEENLFDLYCDFFEDGERLVQLHHWLAQRPAALGPIRQFVARSEGTLVGALTAVPVELRAGGRKLCGCWQQNTVVRPGFRRSGVARELVEIASAGCDLVLAKGTSASMYALRKGKGFRDVGRATFQILALTPFGTLPSMLQSAAYVWGRFRGPCRERGPVRSVELDGFDSGFDESAARLAETDALRVHKPARYLDWRYLCCPVRSYRVIGLRDTTSRGEAVVIRSAPSPGGIAWLVDLVGVAASDGSAHDLVDAAVRAARADGAGAIGAFATGRRMRRLLARYGFLDAHRTPRFTYRRSGEIGTPPPTDWEFWHGDGDTEVVSEYGRRHGST